MEVMDITSEMIKRLRDKTGVGMMDCKRALESTGGDMDAAIEYLRKKGAAVPVCQLRAIDPNQSTEEGIGGLARVGNPLLLLLIYAIYARPRKLTFFLESPAFALDEPFVHADREDGKGLARAGSNAPDSFIRTTT